MIWPKVPPPASACRIWALRDHSQRRRAHKEPSDTAELQQGASAYPREAPRGAFCGFLVPVSLACGALVVRNTNNPSHGKLVKLTQAKKKEKKKKKEVRICKLFGIIGYLLCLLVPNQSTYFTAYPVTVSWKGSGCWMSPSENGCQ